MKRKQGFDLACGVPVQTASLLYFCIHLLEVVSALHIVALGVTIWS